MVLSTFIHSLFQPLFMLSRFTFIENSLDCPLTSGKSPLVKSPFSSIMFKHLSLEVRFLTIFTLAFKSLCSFKAHHSLTLSLAYPHCIAENPVFPSRVSCKTNRLSEFRKLKVKCQLYHFFVLKSYKNHLIFTRYL